MAHTNIDLDEKLLTEITYSPAIGSSKPDKISGSPLKPSSSSTSNCPSGPAS